jgi:general stress protein YciG
MASSNPSNFANLPKDELREIAAKGGHASHGGGAHTEDVSHHLTAEDTLPLTSLQSSNAHADRNADGTFTKGSDLAKELGAQGGHASHGGEVSIL